MLKTNAELGKMADMLRLDIIKMVGVGQKGHLVGQSAHGYDELLAEYGLTAENIIATVKELNG